jgi:uncharacterized repeat protein (TIGR01451 family)
MKNINLIYALLISFFLFSAQAVAAEGNVKLTNKVFKQVIKTDDKGKKTLDYIDPAIALPGDVMFYTTTFENIGREPATKVVVNNPIHSNLKYRTGSAKGKDTEIKFSIDGGVSYDSPEKLFVTDKTGKRWVAKPEDYTSIRWIYKKSLQPGEKSTVSFRAMIRKPGE